MGADLLVNAIAVRDNTEIDYDLGRFEAAHMVFSGELETLVDIYLADVYNPDEFYDPYTKMTYEDAVRNHLLDQIRELEDSLTNHARDTTYLYFGGYTIYIAGGTSWGDSPGPTFQALQDLWEVPNVLEAMGFEWPGVIEPTEDLPLEMEA